MKIPSNLKTIIDGYNLIFQCGLEGRSRNPMALEKARGRLVRLIAKHLSEADCTKTLIAFDAERLPIKETEKVSRQNGVWVAYSIDHDDADSHIEELIRTHAAPKQLAIVSSDHRLHKAAIRRGASPIDSDIWLDRLENGDFSRGPRASNEADDENPFPIRFLISIGWKNLVWMKVMIPKLWPQD